MTAKYVRCVSLFTLAALGGAGVARAQAVPRLSVASASYHTLVSGKTLIKPAMCQTTDAHCLRVAVGQPLFTLVGSTAGDALGNIYVSDLASGTVARIVPSGAITLVAGEYREPATPLGEPKVFAGPASALELESPTVAADASGNLYIAETVGTAAGVLLKVNEAGLATPLTAVPHTASVPKDGAKASTQAVVPYSPSLDANGNVYFVDGATCTVREIVAATGILRVVAGTIAGCSGASSSKTIANKISQALIQGAAAAPDGTVYLVSQTLGLQSVTTDGVLHVLGLENPDAVASGIIGAGAAIGVPSSISTDLHGNIYVESWYQYSIQGRYHSSMADAWAIVEIPRPIAGAAIQAIVLGTGLPPLNAGSGEGTPSTLNVTYPSGANVTADRLGRLIVPTDGVSTLGRDGAMIFDSTSRRYEQLLTLTNLGNAALHGQIPAGEYTSFVATPTAADLHLASVKGAAPFVVNAGAGTCAAHTMQGDFVLAPGATCTVAIDYVPNPALPAAGSAVLFTDDPLGPLTISLSAAKPSTASFVASSFVRLTAVDVAKGTVSFHAALSAVTPTAPYGLEAPLVPTGDLVVILRNTTNGTPMMISARVGGGATAVLTQAGLAPGTYTAQAFYPGDGHAVASYSPVLTFVVLK